MAIDFKGKHHPESVILHAVHFYARYVVPYRDLEETLAERGIQKGQLGGTRFTALQLPVALAV